MILLDSSTGIIHNVSSSDRSTLTIHFMRACRGSRLASARCFISVPQSDRRSDFVPANGGDIVQPSRLNFVREADFVLRFSKHYSISKHWEAKPSIFSENRENFATELRENFHLWCREFLLMQREFRLSTRFYKPCAAPLRTNFLYFVIRTSGCYAANSPVRSAGADFVGTACRYRPARWAGFRPRSGFRFSSVPVQIFIQA